MDCVLLRRRPSGSTAPLEVSHIITICEACRWCALIRLHLATFFWLFTVLVDAGSRYEVDYTSGISHFIHRLAFQVATSYLKIDLSCDKIFNGDFTQSTPQFESREAIMTELESYGGVFECQRFRDLMMYSVSVFSYGLPRAMEILADCMWRPKITEEEVHKYTSVLPSA